ncbi:multidrug resistance protein ABC transporter family protein [Tasmannia lanceolata]|uniref:multidrug resistance protein ABC transporter family protein n=1 Tax=Tasmannia lanceolata TaxID=3420 RepID=UPI0040632D6F
MGNYVSHRTCDINGKVILPDGTIHIIDRPISVAELMLEHPQQFVVDFQSLMAGKRSAPLPADKNLEMKKVYLMLPMKWGKAVTLSAGESHRLLAKVRFVLRSGSFSASMKMLPWFAKICPAGVGKGDGIVLRKDGLVENCDGPRSLLENFAERPEFLSRQFSGKGWKPNLETIKEKVVEKKASHWMF